MLESPLVTCFCFKRHELMIIVLRFMTSSWQLKLKSISILRELVFISRWVDFSKLQKARFNCLVVCKWPDHTLVSVQQRQWIVCNKYLLPEYILIKSTPCLSVYSNKYKNVVHRLLMSRFEREPFIFTLWVSDWGRVSLQTHHQVVPNNMSELNPAFLTLHIHTTLLYR